MSTTERIVALNTVPGLVKQAILEAEDDELIDVLGTANSIQSQIGDIKRTAAAEVSDGDHGKAWAFEQGRKAERSYNTQGLFTRLLEEIDVEDLPHLIVWLMGRDVIRLSWQWTPLLKLIKEFNLDLKITRHEIEDGDPDFEIGEYWKPASPSYKAVTDEG